MKETIKLRSGATIPLMSPEEAEQKRYLTRTLLAQMHLTPSGDPVAFFRNEDGSLTYFFDPARIVETPPELWYEPKRRQTETIETENGHEVVKMSTRRAAACGYYTKERLSQMNYDVVEEPVAYTVRRDKSVAYFYDKKTAVKRPLMCVQCGKDVRYRHKLCKACFEADLALRREEGDRYRAQHFHETRDKVLFFDLELTGVYDHDEILSITIINGHGKVLMDTLVKPAKKRRWKQTEKIHGITPDMVKDAPSLASLTDEIKALFADAHNIIAYGVSTDYSHIKKIYETKEEQEALREKTRCAAIEFIRYRNEHEPDLVHGSLGDAMELLGIAWDGVAHTSIADTIGCAKVWEALFPNYYDD